MFSLKLLCGLYVLWGFLVVCCVFCFVFNFLKIPWMQLDLDVPTSCTVWWSGDCPQKWDDPGSDAILESERLRVKI